MPLSDEQIVVAIEGGEGRRVEFKGPRLLGERHPRAEVMRAIFAMANLRGGGLVIVGVNDNGVVPGLTAEQAASWRNEQRARQSAAASAQPAVDFDVDVRTVTIAGEQKVVAVIDVREFDDYPIICTRHVPSPQHGEEPLLRIGAVYVRNHIPASVEVSDHSLMRELLELATDKGVARFVRTAGGAGLMMSAEQSRRIVRETVAAMREEPAAAQPAPPFLDDAAQFDQQRHDFEDGDNE